MARFILTVIALLGTLWVSSESVGQTSPVPSEADDADRLSLQEEEFAYAAKKPGARVDAFLKIANRKIETATRRQKGNPESHLVESLRGYLDAFQGARMGISWGKSLGEDMRSPTANVAKTVRKHATALEKLERRANAKDKLVIRQMLDALLALQSKPSGQPTPWESGQLSPSSQK